ncbi:hypothetical protein EYF80_056006 [Liparis tanakae]|uniref:Uncharacterized protein n=1 Tax=Liparis tanakae TaxID=230148 RepID=A0A4Z2EYJ2_9TELE|nr:hypothetical protein EYF80_056006 [Liparis tanakae]
MPAKDSGKCRSRSHWSVSVLYTCTTLVPVVSAHDVDLAVQAAAAGLGLAGPHGADGGPLVRLRHVELGRQHVEAAVHVVRAAAQRVDPAPGAGHGVQHSGLAHRGSEVPAVGVGVVAVKRFLVLRRNAVTPGDVQPLPAGRRGVTPDPAPQGLHGGPLVLLGAVALHRRQAAGPVAPPGGVQPPPQHVQLELDARLLQRPDAQPAAQLRVVAEAGVHRALAAAVLQLLPPHHVHKVVQHGHAGVAAARLHGRQLLELPRRGVGQLVQLAAHRAVVVRVRRPAEGHERAHVGAHGRPRALHLVLPEGEDLVAEGLQEERAAALVLHHHVHRLHAVHQLRGAHEREAHVAEDVAGAGPAGLVVPEPADGGAEEGDLAAVPQLVAPQEEDQALGGEAQEVVLLGDLEEVAEGEGVRRLLERRQAEGGGRLADEQAGLHAHGRLEELLAERHHGEHLQEHGGAEDVLHAVQVQRDLGAVGEVDDVPEAARRDALQLHGGLLRLPHAAGGQHRPVDPEALLVDGQLHVQQLAPSPQAGEAVQQRGAVAGGGEGAARGAASHAGGRQRVTLTLSRHRINSREPRGGPTSPRCFPESRPGSRVVPRANSRGTTRGAPRDRPPPPSRHTHLLGGCWEANSPPSDSAIF